MAHPMVFSVTIVQVRRIQSSALPSSTKRDRIQPILLLGYLVCLAPSLVRAAVRLAFEASTSSFSSDDDEDEVSRRFRQVVFLPQFQEALDRLFPDGDAALMPSELSCRIRAGEFSFGFSATTLCPLSTVLFFWIPSRWIRWYPA